ncbi:hypothetical protein [Mesorhizobium sp. M0768]|uniref:hypothetical protein n=1 Tax=Mesorhizobium sp. M0768 TaxID=2956996 RepID=UPI00333AF76B
METSVPAEYFSQFYDSFTANLVMPIIIERYGSKMARDLEGVIMECLKDSSKRPDITYPRF